MVSGLREASAFSHPAVYFEYVGRTTLTAVGPVSGKHYRFVGPGAQLIVDPRDKLSLAAVPNLRQVTNPKPRRSEAADNFPEV
jgi:hypothetical protein